MKIVLLGMNHDSVGTDERPAAPPLIAGCEGYSIAGDQLVVSQTAGQLPRLPFVSLEHQSMVFTHDDQKENGNSIAPVPGLVHVTIVMADKIGTYRFWATDVITGPDGTPMLVQPADAQDKIVYIDRTRIATLSTTAPLTAESIAAATAEAEASPGEPADGVYDQDAEPAEDCAGDPAASEEEE